MHIGGGRFGPVVGDDGGWIRCSPVTLLIVLVFIVLVNDVDRELLLRLCLSCTPPAQTISALRCSTFLLLMISLVLQVTCLNSVLPFLFSLPSTFFFTSRHVCMSERC